MSAPPVICVETLGKSYTLGGSPAQGLLRDRLVSALRAPGRWLRDGPRVADEEFWALRDVSFSVHRGDVVGIVGRNGAGKSTLLKILSRITEPTRGRITLRGRVASLLEVGTGFHPELTGRENVFLNGAILGMPRAEITRKFDEIVAFSGVERFIDTPVKRYSSGMYVRLAFAVAAHLEPEILVVDEVLAVGDAAFQKKCLGKMQDVSREQGRTILFVSHNLHAVRQLCRSAILLNAGRIEAAGSAAQVLDVYTQGGEGGADTLTIPAPGPDLLTRGHVLAVAVENAAGRPVPELAVGEPWLVRVKFRALRPLKGFVAGLGIVAADGTAVQTAWAEPRHLPAGDWEAVFHQSAVVLAAGSYGIVVGLSEEEQTFQQFEAARIHLTGERAVGYYQATSGVGTVLNSMPIEIRAASTP